MLLQVEMAPDLKWFGTGQLLQQYLTLDQVGDLTTEQMFSNSVLPLQMDCLKSGIPKYGLQRMTELLQ